MSPIFIAAFLWLIAAILWWSGWREEPIEGVPYWAVGIFLAVWPLAILGSLPVTSSVSLNGAWLWTLISVGALAWRIPPARRWMSLSAGILIGSVAILLGRIAYSPIGIAHGYTPWAIPILVGLLAALFLRSLPEQVLAISLSLILSEGIAAIVQAPGESMSEIRGAAWLEGWWIAVSFARLWSAAVKSAVEHGRKLTLKFSGKRGGQRL
ncbi:hypothetical protein [Cohnella terricola]|uniref:Uncharacterized protein n=1 Tax=Cohnella terricola TaxID=1289167 RepID=A0A559JXD8_9BACL|nr:hypothetical protein [Cohnella terricola]TVY04549.1 hypothetical protein FPZ45_02945 [Cohnella terricola]